MARSSFPQRVVQPKLLLGFGPWSGLVCVILGVIALLVTNLSELTWPIKIILVVLSCVGPFIVYAFWKYTSFLCQRQKQYNLLYDDLERMSSHNQQLQVNFTFL